MSWYVMINGQKVGPFDAEQLNSLAATGLIPVDAEFIPSEEFAAEMELLKKLDAENRNRSAPSCAAERCWFCKTGEAVDVEKIAMSLETQWSLIGAANRWKFVEVPISRCAACKKSRTKLRRVVSVPFYVALLSFLVQLVIFWITGKASPEGFGFSFLGIIISSVVGWFLGWFLLVDDFSSHPEVKKLLDAGWDFGVPFNTRIVRE